MHKVEDISHDVSGADVTQPPKQKRSITRLLGPAVLIVGVLSFSTIIAWYFLYDLSNLESISQEDLQEKTTSEWRLDQFYVVRAETLYFEGSPVEGFDTATIEEMPRSGTGYVKDATAVYYMGKSINADTDTFSYLESGYARDDDAIYYAGKRVEEADRNTFRTTASPHAYDADTLFFAGEVVTEEALESFEVIAGEYYVFEGDIYYRDHLLYENVTEYSFVDGELVVDDDIAHQVDKPLSVVFINSKNIDTLLGSHGWAKATSTTQTQSTSTQAAFYYDEDYISLNGGVFKPSAGPVDDAMVISTLEKLGYSWRISIPDYGNLTLSGVAADGPSGSMHGMLKYDSESDSLHTVVVSSHRYLNDVCVENNVEWYGEGVGQDGCEIESDVEVFVSNVVRALPLLGIEDLPSEFKITDGEVYYRGQLIQWADPRTFKLVKDYAFGSLCRDEENVYLLEDYNRFSTTIETLDYIDPSTLEALDYNFIKDKYNVYLVEGSKITVLDLDPNSFKYLDCGYYLDKENVYYGSPGYLYGGRSPGTALGGEIDTEEFKKTFRVFTCDGMGAEGNLTLGYVGYSGGVYLGAELVPSADIESFEYLGSMVLGDYVGNVIRIAKDRDHIYMGTDIVQGDPNTYKVSSMNAVTLDKDNVYYAGKVVEGAEPDSFEVLNFFYSKDSQRVYVPTYDGLEILVGADSDSFEVLEYYYNAKDNINAYSGGEKIEGVDIDSYEVLSRHISRDKNYVYYRGEVVEGVNPKNCTSENLAGCRAP